MLASFWETWSEMVLSNFPARNLLLATVRSDPPVEFRDQVRSFSDWELLLKWLRQLRLAPRAYLILRRSGTIDYLPEKYQNALKATYDENLGHNIACSSLLIRLVTMLGSEGIEVALLKGIAYIHDCYSDPGERVVGDIDLLIREEKVDAALSILAKHGFKINPTWASRHPGHHHIVPICDESGITFEIHHNLAPVLAPVAVSNQLLWKDVRPCKSLLGSYLLHPIDALIHSSIHLMVNSSIAQQLYQLVDIHQLIRTHFKTKESVSALLQRAKAFSCTLPLTQALALAQRQIGTEEHFDLVRLCNRKSFLLHLAGATIAGPAGGVSIWRFELYRDLLDYRKQLLMTPWSQRRLLFILSRPFAILRHLVSVFLGRSAIFE